MNGFYMPIELEIDCFQHKIIKFGKSPVWGLAGGWGITNMILAYFLPVTCEYFCYELICVLALHTKRILNLLSSSQNKEVLIFVAWGVAQRVAGRGHRVVTVEWETSVNM